MAHTDSISICLIVYTLMASMSSITITAWNMRTLSCARPLINELVNEYKADILCLSEHRLYNSELYKLSKLGIGYEVHAKASHDLNDNYLIRKPGHYSVAILWNKAIANKVKVFNCDSDRICAIEVIGAIQDKSLFVFSVYFPHQQCRTSNFKEHVDILVDATNECRLHGEVLVIGDTNCHFGEEVGDRFNGNPDNIFR